MKQTFQAWRDDLERRASAVKETSESTRAYLDKWQGKLVSAMTQVEELVDYYDGARQPAGAHFIINSAIEMLKKQMAGLDPASPDFDIETTTYPQSLVDFLLDITRVTIEHLTEMKCEVGQYPDSPVSQ